MWKSVLVGAIVAVLVVIGASAGGYLYVSSSGGASDAEQQDRVVLIFESPAEDGATVAALVSLVAEGRMRDISPDTTVSIPGTSHTRLSDAFVFGGGRAVASAIETSQGAGTAAFVSVPEGVWRASLDATQGVKVTVPEKVTVFDGSRLVSVPSGEQTLTADVAGALLRSLPYVTGVGGANLRGELERQLARALVAADPGVVQLDSDLADETLGLWLKGQLADVVTEQAK